MPPWDAKFVDHSNWGNKTSQQVIEEENDNKDRQQPKIQ